MELKLNIYTKDGQGNLVIEKVYEANTINIMFGTAEDLINVLDGVNLNDVDNLLNLVTKGLASLKPLLKDVFTGLTDEELRKTKLNELIPLFAKIFKYLFQEIGMTNGVSVGKN